MPEKPSPNGKHSLPTTNYKLLAIVGPTASGKSELAVTLAKLYNGEIISCDSRQVYKGMDIGTGKIKGKWKKGKFVYKGVTHYCIDYVDPKKQFSVSLFQRDAEKALEDIRRRGKLPILCGGTGLWIDAVVHGQKLPEVKPNPKLRKQLEKQSVDELFEQLKELDPDRAATIDWHNKRRLVRALEIVMATGKPVPVLASSPSSLAPSLYIGIYPGQDELYKKIDKRLLERIKTGMIKEIQTLKKSGLSYKRLEAFGLEYKFVALYLQKKLSKDEMLEQLSFAIKHYAKRQMTWFRKNENIVWLENPQLAKKIVAEFLQ